MVLFTLVFFVALGSLMKSPTKKGCPYYWYNMVTGLPRICPVFTGPVLVLAHLSLSALLMLFLWLHSARVLLLFPWGGLFICTMLFPSLMLVAYVVLAHCRSIDVMQIQVGDFTVEQSLSDCCSRDHVSVKGGPMACDRVILIRCIEAWFGSVDAFESLVRTEVLNMLVHQLSYHVFTYWRIVQASCPVLWAVLDLMHMNYPDRIRGLVQLLCAAVSYCLLLLPSLALILIRLAYRMRRLGNSLGTRLLISVGLVASASLMFGSFFVFDRQAAAVARYLFDGNDLPGYLAVLAITSALGTK